MADRQRLPSAAEDDLLVRDEAGQPNGVDRRVGPHPLGGRLRGARRRVALRLGVQLDDLRAREDLRRLLGEAHHQHGSEREVRCVEARHAGVSGGRVHRVEVESRRSDDDGHAGREARLDVRDDRVGAREVDRDVAPAGPSAARVDHLVPGVAQRRLEERPDLPGRRRTARRASGGLVEQRRD